ncbi:MAG: Gfo/Idh/MocA family oxidoreductase, partial [Acidobacteria bacterium]|nr:Gfo/Idh/MocA family oxidoreductase [Acidobacteriota bacterium]
MAKITMLGTGLIGTFYTQTLHGLRSRDRVVNVYSRSAERARAFAAERGIPRWSADLREAVGDPESEIVVVGLPNNIHREAVFLAVEAKKAVLCTKPLGRTAAPRSSSRRRPRTGWSRGSSDRKGVGEGVKHTFYALLGLK